jgi:hypothetical protein
MIGASLMNGALAESDPFRSEGTGASLVMAAGNDAALVEAEGAEFDSDGVAC